MTSTDAVPASSPVKDEQDKSPLLTKTPPLAEFSLEDVVAHNQLDDCWLVIRVNGVRKVYDVTKFLDDHPGGPEIILELAGQDATDEFEDIGHSNDARAQLAQWEIGQIKGDVADAAPAAARDNGSGTVMGNGKTTSPLPILIASLLVVIVALMVKYLQ